MSNESVGNMLMQTVKKVATAIVRIVAFVFAWCFKIVGQVCEKIGNEILKISEK